MSVLSISQLYHNLKDLKEIHKRNTKENLVLYILNPFISSLGYDIFDMNEVEIELNLGRVKVKPQEDVKFIFSVSASLPREQGDVYIYFDVSRYQLEVHVNALGKWELLERIDLQLHDDDVNDQYVGITRIIEKESFQIAYMEREKRLFTERVLRSKLERGDLENPFVVYAVKELIQNPSENLLFCIAEVLAEKFSTDTTDELQRYLVPLQDIGLQNIIEQVTSLNDVSTDTRKSKPRTEIQSYRQEEVEVVSKEDTTTKFVEQEQKTTEETILTDEVVEEENQESIQDELSLEEENQEDVQQEEQNTEEITEDEEEIDFGNLIRTERTKSMDDLF